MILEGLTDEQLNELMSKLEKMYDRYSLEYLTSVLECDGSGKPLLDDLEGAHINTLENMYKRLFIVGKGMDIINKELYEEFMQANAGEDNSLDE